MKSIIKWVGGKTQLLPEIKKMLPSAFSTYYEPFLGGGAVLLDLLSDNAVSKAIVSDINPELINLYKQVRDNPEMVISLLTTLDALHTRSADPKQFYYETREAFNTRLGDNTPGQAARFIYLNKHCFNGLYRVNKKGEFNVPFNGKNSGSSFDEKNLLEVSERFKDVTFLLCDFSDTVKNASAGDLVFFDSPYAPIKPTSFIDYTKEGFAYEDHVRLAKLFKELTDRGVYCMLTNHDTDMIRD